LQAQYPRVRPPQIELVTTAALRSVTGTRSDFAPSAAALGGQRGPYLCARGAPSWAICVQLPQRHRGLLPYQIELVVHVITSARIPAVLARSSSMTPSYSA
jgi:hypothetical protein